MKPMLSATIEAKSENRSLDDIKYPVQCSYKLDGIRCLIVDGEPVSRTLKPIANKHIRETLRSLELPALDGELIVGHPSKPDTYTKTASGVMSESGQPNFLYHIFDTFDEEVKDETYTIRYDWLRSKVVEQKRAYMSDCLFVVENFQCDTKRVVKNLEVYAVHLGYEGIMVRQEGPYKMGRSTFKQGYLMKLKRFLEMDGVITGFEELQVNKNEPEIDNLGHQVRSSKKGGKVPGNTLGALNLRINWEGEERQLKVGSGFDAALRQQIWDRQDYFRGSTVTFKYFPPVKEGGLPRQPIFLCFRLDEVE